MNDQGRLSWTDVRDEIRARILSRTYAPGDKLPRDEDIAVEFGCARTTVHRAMQELAQNGLIERKRKGGTHVMTDPVTRATFDIPITRREVERRGSKYGYQLISRKLDDTPMPVMARFGIQQPAQMLHVKALHLADNRPYIFEDRWVDTQSTPDILNVNLEVESANEWLVRNKLSGNESVMVFLVLNVIELEPANHLRKNSPIHRRLLAITLGCWTSPIRVK